MVQRLEWNLAASAMNERFQSNQMRAAAAWRGGERGFTLVEMLMATVIVVVGLVAVAQLVPTSMMLNANNRSDGSALVIAQKQMEALRALPLSATTFTDPLGVTCPLGTTCYTGDPSKPGQVVGSPLFNNTPIIDYAQPLVTGYGFTYTDPNDPTGAVNDVRWAVVTINNGATTGKRIIVGAFRRGMKSPSFPISLDTLVSK
jgi:prepilin-type N-terminal cleavage/methylation domain-containing protein